MLCSLAFGAVSPAFAGNGTGVRTADPLTWPVPTPAEAAARARAGDAFTADLVAALLARSEPRLQLAAAVLMTSLPDRQAEAQTLFARIRRDSDDPVVLHVAANKCPFDAATCDADGAIDALRARDPRDAEAIFLALDRAKRQGDSAAFDPLLDALADAEFRHGHLLAAYRWWSEVFGLMGDDPRLPMIGGSLAVDARPLTPEIAIGVAALGRAWAVPFVGRGALREGCAAALADPARSGRRSTCRAVAARLREQGPTRGDQIVGYRLGWAMASDDAERARLELDWRRREWQARAADIDTVPPAQHPGGLAGWRASTARYFALLHQQPTESAAMAIHRAEVGAPSEPPPDYRPTYTLAEHAVRAATQR